MFSLRLAGDYMDIRTETRLNSQQFNSYSDFMRSLPGAYYVSDSYKWMVPKIHVDAYATKYEETTAWHNTIESIKGISEVQLPEFPVLTDFEDFKIKPYEFQQQGISFLTHVGSGILGDDMGLGKTVQTMGAAHMLWKAGKVRKVLVICPSSLKYQWNNEIDKFIGHSTVVIDGKNTKQKKQALQEFIHGDALFGIINYELVRVMVDEMKEHHYDVIIADEAHRLKNKDSQTYKAVNSLSSTHRFASTGTPLQNNVEELYALIDWIKPGLLGKITNFRKRYIVYASKFGRRFVPTGHKHLGELRKTISPYMLRRLKKDVATELPPIIFHRRDVHMQPDQAKLYAAIQEDFLNFMSSMSTQEVKGQYDAEGNWVEEKRQGEDKVLGYLYMMMAASDHPELLRLGKGMAAPFKHLIPDKPRSSKLIELVEFAKEQVESGTEKIIIFTQYAQMQKIIVQELVSMGKVAVLNGSMSSAKRQEQLEIFQNDPEYKFFVLTDAGNFGLNLQYANTLINYDSPWNPAIVDQRAGRVHRIGSTHDVVNIIDLVSLNSIDEKIQDVLVEKRQIGEAVIERNEMERSTMNSLIASLQNAA